MGNLSAYIVSSSEPEGTRAANDPGQAARYFTPVPPNRVRYRRGLEWATRTGIGAPDFERLTFIRTMERVNCG
jgi:hypothetical protein